MNNNKEKTIEKINLMTKKFNSLHKIHLKKITPFLEKQKKIKLIFFCFITPFAGVLFFHYFEVFYLLLLYPFFIGFVLLHAFFNFFPRIFSKSARRNNSLDKKIKKEINRLEVEKKSLLLELKNNDILFFSEKGIDEKSIDVILEKEFREQHADLFLIIEKISDELDFSERRTFKKTLDNELKNHLKNN